MHETVTSLPNRQCPEQGRFFLLNTKHMKSRTLSLELNIYIYQDLVLGVTYVDIVQDLVLGVTYVYIAQDSVLRVKYVYIYIYV